MKAVKLSEFSWFEIKTLAAKTGVRRFQAHNFLSPCKKGFDGKLYSKDI